MKKYLLAAAAAAALASPAAARDGSGYVGVEGGVLFAHDEGVNFAGTYSSEGFSYDFDGSFRTNYSTGVDLDLIAGYDFGMFRLEGELGYKRARAKSINVNSDFVTALNTGAGTDFVGGDFNIGGKTSVLSGMVNGLVDFGGNGGPGFYAGGGVGAANVKQFGSSDTKFAWQLLAGAYMPVSNNLDVGLKYRYFRAGRSSGSDAFPFSAGATTCGALPCSGGVATFDTDSRFSSHSLLASLVYNFGGETAVAAPPPPPPAPVVEAPATQTCPDGSVILATAACPAPPPPPPPPPPATQGERG